MFGTISSWSHLPRASIPLIMAPDSLEHPNTPLADAPNVRPCIMQEASHDVPKSPDNASIRTHSNLATSSSAASYTSTIRYGHESYEDFSKRVESLCQILWPPQKSLKHRVLNSRAATYLRANKTFGSFVPSKQTPLIERLSGGDYNRITGITLPPLYGTEGRELILRTQRGDEGRQDRDLAILSYVRQWTSIPAYNCCERFQL